MQSSQIVTPNDIQQQQAKLYEALTIMLQEASLRESPQEAAYVISGVLNNLSRDHPEMSSLAQNWVDLAKQHSLMSGGI
ncbi:hypothetical protein HLX14_004143 [Escherichia coli]|uniref:hypothetical protein n=1 Tax=Edwardsiella TaxID=635 RepID=UPI00090073CC|nr:MULTISPECIES: hypothetical protein [Edwardsiella]EFP0183665.1 hypothetical protein [Escherichia coli]EGA8339103.1 hypothetical protein [Salmonella enterica subsp. enterica serovar Saintpaul]EKG9744416.1 hypothetical protein [Salmonella enterica]EKS7763316.1 hypothetical protein [Edwardsiella ictaluri]EKS7789731.1 hypothetical protein [Edwardsiella ictaluri]